MSVIQGSIPREIYLAMNYTGACAQTKTLRRSFKALEVHILDALKNKAVVTVVLTISLHTHSLSLSLSLYLSSTHENRTEMMS